jgi:bifunctional non-homologous end joining protein LigD
MHCGSVGSGLTAASRQEWQERLSADVKVESPFGSLIPRTTGRIFHWSAPSHVVEVAFGEWPRGGHLRHPVYLGFRIDKSPESVVREQ